MSRVANLRLHVPVRRRHAPKSAVFNRLIEDGMVEIRGLPMGVAVDDPFHDPLKRAKFLTGPWF